MNIPIEADVLLIDFAPHITALAHTDRAAAWLRARVPEHEDRDEGSEGAFLLPHSAATDALLDDMEAAGFTLDGTWGG